MSENLKFTWQTSINADSKQTEAGTLLISGELVNADVCANNFALDAEELSKVASQVKGATLRVDHSKSARDVVGGLTLGTHDPKGNKVFFEAEVDDPIIQRSIMKGRLKYVSIGASADAFCSKCGKTSKPRLCSCKGAHDVIRNIQLKEASIVTEPAYKNSSFSPQGFTAAITSALAEDLVTPNSSKDEDEARPLENKIKGENKIMSEEIKATTLKPAGGDAVVLLAEKLEGLAASISKMEERFKKSEEDEVKKKKEVEETKKNEAFTKLEALAVKLEEFMKPKKEETSKGIPKDVPSSKFEEDESKAKKEFPIKEKKETPAEEEPDEDDVPVKKAKKEAKGSKVEDASGNSNSFTAEEVPTWFKEIRAFAEKNGVLDY